MKTINQWNSCFRKPAVRLARASVVAGLLLCTKSVLAQPGPGQQPLDSWSFSDDIGWTSDLGYPPLSFMNLAYSNLGNGATLVVDTNVPAWLQFPAVESDGTTNLALAAGGVTFWYAPGSWSSTNGGPGQCAQLIDVGELTTNAASGYWGLLVDAAGQNLWFISQDGLGNSYSVSAPISWTINYFHFIALTYSPTNVSLYLDGVLTTNDPGGLSVLPDTDVLANGFFIGSDTNGLYQAQGLFNTVATYSSVLDSNTVQQIYDSQLSSYEVNPWNSLYMNLLSSAPSNPTNYLFTNSIIPDVITGPGYLQWDGAATNCAYNATNPYCVWFTNVFGAVAGSGTMNVTFSINGGQGGYLYDVFATSTLVSPITNGIWAWMGQGAACNTYTLTNLSSADAFLILGTPQDSTGDGLTDAYKLLVAHANTNDFSTDGTGMADGWEVLYFGHIGVAPTGDPDGDGLTTFQEWQMRSKGYDPVNWHTFTNSVVGDGYQNYSGDGLANLMQASFGGNMLSNNPAWQLNAAGDGLPDEYKAMVGLNTNSAQPAPGLPAYSMNPIP